MFNQSIINNPCWCLYYKPQISIPYSFYNIRAFSHKGGLHSWSDSDSDERASSQSLTKSAVPVDRSASFTFALIVARILK
eukprot:SAG22_NODE_1755_length_3653_cov_20.353967_1_plen_80_part_00